MTQNIWGVALGARYVVENGVAFYRASSSYDAVPKLFDLDANRKLIVAVDATSSISTRMYVVDYSTPTAPTFGTAFLNTGYQQGYTEPFFATCPGSNTFFTSRIPGPGTTLFVDQYVYDTSTLAIARTTEVFPSTTSHGGGQLVLFNSTLLGVFSSDGSTPIPTLYLMSITGGVLQTPSSSITLSVTPGQWLLVPRTDGVSHDLAVLAADGTAIQIVTAAGVTATTTTSLGTLYGAFTVYGVPGKIYVLAGANPSAGVNSTLYEVTLDAGGAGTVTVATLQTGQPTVGTGNYSCYPAAQVHGWSPLAGEEYPLSSGTTTIYPGYVPMDVTTKTLSAQYAPTSPTAGSAGAFGQFASNSLWSANDPLVSTAKAWTADRLACAVVDSSGDISIQELVPGLMAMHCDIQPNFFFRVVPGTKWTVGALGWSAHISGGGTITETTVLAGGVNSASTHTLLGSSDATTWTVAPNPMDAGEAVLGIGWNGSLWVAVGQWNSGHVVMTSPDGTAWTARTSPLDGTAQGTSVLWDGTQWVVGVILGTHSIMTSPDGVTWTARSTPLDGTTGTWGVYAVAFHAGTYVAAGQHASNLHSILTSSDAVTWTAVSNPFDTAGSGLGSAVIWDGTQWVVGGQDAAGHVILTSPTAATWTAQTTPFDHGAVLGLAWNGTTHVAAGWTPASNSALMTSPDAATWTARTSPLDSSTGQGQCVIWSTTLSEWIAGASGNGGSVLATSPDGAAWTTHTTPFDTGGAVFAVASK